MEAPSRSQQVVGRAQRDPDYRARLLADPAAAVSEELGLPVPDGLTVRVVEEQPGEVVLVLPATTPADAPLDDDALAALAGGYCGAGSYHLSLEMLTAGPPYGGGGPRFVV